MAVTGELYSVVERGRDLLPYPSSKVAKVRIADTATVYIETERPPVADIVNGAAMLAAAALALACYWLLRRIGPADRAVLFFGLLGAGVGFLALDELFGLHETLGHNMRFLADLPGIDRPDDVILTLYALPAFAFVVAFRDLVLASLRATLLGALALELYVTATIADHIRWSIEEEFETLTGVLVLAFVMVLARMNAERTLAEYPR